MIALSAGHNQAARGACHEGRCEHELALRWVARASALLRDQFKEPVGHVPPATLAEKVTWINNTPGIVLACEIHFNSDESKRQRGCETLFAPGSVRGRSAAELVQAELAGVFYPSRGAKEGWYRMDRPDHVDYRGDVEGDEAADYFLVKTRPVALIVEPEFIYNAEVLDERELPGCMALAAGLAKAYAFLTGPQRGS